MATQEELLQFIQERDVLEPETLRQLFPELSEEEFNQTMALKVLKHTRGFFENFSVFEDVTLALNGEIPDFGMIQGCTPEQIWYAINLADQIRPGLEYSEEVKAYVKFCSNDQGVFIYHPALGIDNPYYEKAKQLAEQGPFPLTEETTEEIQAAKLLVIQEYLKEKANG